ncbi:MAG: hypothetical protein MZU95_14905, partial [Desulfomicrobium escambiense]|nr:hypothetical protein [Desulfomicrobium escambiense]
YVIRLNRRLQTESTAPEEIISIASTGHSKAQNPHPMHAFMSLRYGCPWRLPESNGCDRERQFTGHISMHILHDMHLLTSTPGFIH